MSGSLKTDELACPREEDQRVADRTAGGFSALDVIVDAVDELAVSEFSGDLNAAKGAAIDRIKRMVPVDLSRAEFTGMGGILFVCHCGAQHEDGPVSGSGLVFRCGVCSQYRLVSNIKQTPCGSELPPVARQAGSAVEGDERVNTAAGVASDALSDRERSADLQEGGGE